MRTIHIDGPIGQQPGEISARWFRSQLPTNGESIDVRFHCEGGSLFEAFAIYDVVSAYRGAKTASVESMAFSAASLLLCAFDSVSISPNGYVMLHAPYSENEDVSPSDQRLLSQLRERMIGLYCQKTGKPRSFIARALDAEVFYDAEAAVSLGIVNRIAKPSSAVMARALPARVMAKLRTKQPVGATATARWKAAVVIACGNVSAANKQNPGLRLAMLAETNKR